MSNTSTTTGIRITTAADGTRSVAVRTSTTVRTGPDFREQLERACHPSAAANPSAAHPVTPAASPATPVASGATTATAASPCTNLAELRSQLRELIQQLLELLERAGGPMPANHTPSAPPATAPSASTPTTSSATTQPTTPCSAPPRRVFDVRPAGDAAAAPTGQIVVGGSIAAEPVTPGEKLDEGIRRLASFLQQIDQHVKAGGTFTDAQLQSIADETLGIYSEAIRATTGDGDVGDYSLAARDGVLDLGASTRSIIVQATVHAAEPMPTATDAAPATDAMPIAA